MYGVFRKSQDRDLITIIRKCSRLAFVSISISIITYAWVSLWPLFLSSLWYHILGDIYTNASCIFLNYKRFDRFYYCLCGCFDRTCVSRCVDYNHKQDKPTIELENISSNSTVIATNAKLDDEEGKNGTNDNNETTDTSTQI